MPSTSPSPPTTAEPTLPPTRKNRVAIPRATPRTSSSTALPTASIRAGWPSPKATVTPTTAATSSQADPAYAPRAETSSDTVAIDAASPNARVGPIRVSSGPANRGPASAATALGRRATPTCQGSQPRATRTAGTAISRANHAAGTAAAASALRTTAGLRITATGRKPFGRRRTQSRDGRYAEHREHRADDGHGQTGRRGLHEQHHSSGGAGDERCADQVEPGAAALGRHRAPEQGQQQGAEHRQGDHRAPVEQALDRTTGQRPDAAHRGGEAGDPAERHPPDGPGVAGADDGHAQRGHGRGSGALDDPGGEQDPEAGRQRSRQRPEGHHADADQEGQAHADQVRDPAVDSGGDGQHQGVEADRPRAHPGADPEVSCHHRQGDRSRGAAQSGQPEEDAHEDRDPAGVGGGGGRGGG